MSHITRRKFLKKSVGVVTAVIVGPAVLSAIPEKVEAKELTESEMLDNWAALRGLNRLPSEADKQLRVRLVDTFNLSSRDK